MCKELKFVCKLEKSTTPMVSKVLIDDYTKEVSKHFDYDFVGENAFFPYILPKELDDLDFNILAIVGASGKGKSTLSKYFGSDVNINWDNTKSIISNFDNKEEGVEKLCAVGFNDIPSWLKPRNVLSVGEGFRVDLARKIKDNCVIDEFTSTVDRNVALSCSKSIGKYIRDKNIKRCVFVSCHKDFIDVLCPDYIIDLDDECLYDARGLPSRKFKLQIYETKEKRNIWNLFRGHHYLSKDLNFASRIYVAYLDNIPVALCSILPLPSGTLKNAFRVHRLVVLPDYQGLGIGSKLFKEICKLYKSVGKTIYIRTSHIKLYNYMKNNKDFVENSSSGKPRSPNTGFINWFIDTNRIAYSFKWVGDDTTSLNNEYLINK